jgi:hypothetical protein
MNLPTKAQVDAASRHVITAAGVAVTIFGLQAKGVSMDQVTAVIKSLGDTVNTVLQLVAAIGLLYGGVVAAKSASKENQAKAVAATGRGRHCVAGAGRGHAERSEHRVA